MILFYVFAAILVFAGAARHHGAQPGAFGAVPGAVLLHRAVLWMLLEAEFLAIVLVLVYVGAVMVLFLFVVMMLDINSKSCAGFWRLPWPAGWSAR
jgi:NADH-quinone oxidoreductase subunit J